ncbi:hypothetical protein [Acetonema longum]|uniref:Xylose isomerase-like TIM barrel domain-containing protein n=1 Tax=Acetonema longum DSM 6540 TaxID=1009370 RepID=F7NH56_9FIRM|nr:hypothetical protein [Acetonema longum]EGO64539.1 hypothetical protein ALO_07008 [Acetonema longum DSM 6540]
MSVQFTIAAKCSPEEKMLAMVERAGLKGVELYTDDAIIRQADSAGALCAKFPFRYAVHAPTSGYAPTALAEFVQAVKPETVVFHNIYWDDEWPELIQAFDKLPVKLCLENMSDIHEAEKYIRRFGISRCLDFEHYQMQHGGFPSGGATPLMRQTAHVHLTGYTAGSERWHTPIHHAPEQNGRILDLLVRAGYSGLVVSEANVKHQTQEEFDALVEFCRPWMR